MFSQYPWQVLSFRDNRPYLYVVNDSGEAELRWLELGARGLDRVEVLSGLEDGETIVTRGQHLLTTGSQVQLLGGA